MARLLRKNVSNINLSSSVVKYLEMKVSGLLLLVLIFVVIPLYVIQTLLMPALEQLRFTYENVDSIAAKAVQD